MRSFAITTPEELDFALDLIERDGKRIYIEDSLSNDIAPIPSAVLRGFVPTWKPGTPFAFSETFYGHGFELRDPDDDERPEVFLTCVA